jgi:starvation-inducible outer membrane lipoprotein
MGGNRNKKPGPGAHNVDISFSKAKGGYIGQKVKTGGIIVKVNNEVSPASYQIVKNQKQRARPKSATTFGNAERLNSLVMKDEPGPG